MFVFLLAMAGDTKTPIISIVEAFLVGSSSLEKEISYINGRIRITQDIMAWNHEQRSKDEDRNAWFRDQNRMQLDREQSRRVTLLCWREELLKLPF